MQGLGVQIDIHHIWHIGYTIWNAARRRAAPVTNDPDDVSLSIRGTAHVLSQRLIADTPAPSLRRIRIQTGADEGFEDECVALVDADPLLVDADVDVLRAGRDGLTGRYLVDDRRRVGHRDEERFIVVGKSAGRNGFRAHPEPLSQV